MFNLKTQTETTGLDEAIELAFSHLQEHSPDSDEYSKIVDQLDKLYKIKSSYEKDNKRTVSTDQLIAVAGNLAGILLILNFERAGIVTSKALSFVLKSKA